MRILVTGGAGFIGSWLVESLLRDGHSVVVLDNLSEQIHGAHPTPESLWPGVHAQVQFVRADIRDREALSQALAQVDEVVHLAAETGTGQSMYQIDRYYDVNVQGTAKLLELIATQHKHIRRVVFASSRSVYGEGAYALGEQLFVPPTRDAKQLEQGQWEPLGPKREALRLVATPEHAPVSPASIYAATKLASEQTARIVSEAYGLSIIALRFQNVFGERQSLRNPYTGILSIFSNRMRKNLPINIFEDGLESRDFIHVSDVVASINAAREAEHTGFGLFNIGAGVPTSVMQVAEQLKQLLGSASVLQVSGDFRAGDIRHCYADITRARQALGFEPQVALQAGLQRFCRWVQTQAIVEDRSSSAQSELARLGLGRGG